MLVIDPDECIDCTLCVAECPVDAILAADDVPQDEREFISINRDRAVLWPRITERHAAPPDADDWAHRAGKRAMLDAG